MSVPPHSHVHPWQKTHFNHNAYSLRLSASQLLSAVLEDALSWGFIVAIR